MVNHPLELGRLAYSPKISPPQFRTQITALANSKSPAFCCKTRGEASKASNQAFTVRNRAFTVGKRATKVVSQASDVSVQALKVGSIASKTGSVAFVPVQYRQGPARRTPPCTADTSVHYGQPPCTMAKWWYACHEGGGWAPAGRGLSPSAAATRINPLGWGINLRRFWFESGLVEIVVMRLRLRSIWDSREGDNAVAVPSISIGDELGPEPGAFSVPKVPHQMGLRIAPG